MSLTVCRACGTAVPAHAQSCPTCGASMSPVPVAAYRPAPPRPPAPPERPWWRTAAGWMNVAGWLVVVAGCVLVGLFVVRASANADRRATEKAEVAREEEHMRIVFGWVRDTLTDASLAGSTSRPAPTSSRARRMWAVSRMMVDRAIRDREAMARHGASRTTPAAWATAHYQANARQYPEVGRYLAGRLAATEEIEKTSAAWMQERTTALARESGMPVAEIRELFPPDFGSVAPGEARLMEVMLEVHRHLVRADPRVHPGGGNMLEYEREEDMRRIQQLEGEMRDAVSVLQQGRQSKVSREAATLNRAIQ